MITRLLAALCLAALTGLPAQADSLKQAVDKDYDQHLGDLFEWFHRNPELSMMEYKTSERLAAEIREAGFEVTEKVGGTGIVAILENGPGPLVTPVATTCTSRAGSARPAIWRPTATAGPALSC